MIQYFPTITGSLTVNGDLIVTGTGSMSASLALNSNLLQGTGSTGFATTASLTAVSSSQQQISASLLNVVANYATTGSNSFRANQSITGSLVVSSTITAQTLVVQTVTSSIVYSSGSNIFGNQSTNTQTFTGSILTSGNIGLGITPSAWNGIYRVFQIDAGSISSSPSYNNISVGANVFYNAGNSPRYIVNDYATLYGQDDGLHAWYTAPSGTAGAAMTFTQSMTLTAAGNLGVGTSTPTDSIIGASLTMLDITGASGGALKLHHSTTTYGEFSFYKGTNGSFIDSAGASTAANNDLIFRTGRTGSNYTVLEAMRVASTGNVGIGTTNPTATLHIVSPVVASGTALKVVSDGNGNDKVFEFTGVDGLATQTMVMLQTGVVGIGTTNPRDTFVVGSNGGAVLERFASTDPYSGDLYFYSARGTASSPTTKANGDTAMGIRPRCYDGTSYLDVASIVAKVDGTVSTNAMPGNLIFSTNSGGTSLGERMRITPAGDICGIRIVNGIVGSYRNLSYGAATLMARDAYDSYFCGNLYYDAAGWKLKYGSYYGNCVNWYGGEYSFQTSTSAGAADSTVALTATLFLDRSGNAVFKGSVTQNGSPSDINLKENLVKITSPLEKISQINGYNFDWKEGTAANGLAIPVAEGMQAPESPLSIAHDAGLIAQEVEVVMPQLVRDNGHKALNYNGIIALLVEAIKELKAEFDTYKETHP